MRLVAQESVVRHPLKRKSILGQSVLTLLGVLLLFLASFCAFDVPVASQRNVTAFLDNQVRFVAEAVPSQYQSKIDTYAPWLRTPHRDIRKTSYCPLVAAAIFVGYVLGPVLGPLVCLGYVLVGTVGPWLGIFPFASGGGAGYFQEPGFGYLLALIPAAFVAAIITRERNSVTQVLAIIAGLIVVHLSGIFYLLGSCLVSYLLDGNRASLAWQPWVFQLARNMTWYPLPYDFLAALFLVGAGFPFRWLSRVLIGPENGSPQARPAARPAPRQAVANYQTYAASEFL